MTRTRIIAIRMTPQEDADLRVLMHVRNYESASHLIRALIREELCKRKDPVGEDESRKANSGGIVPLVDAGIR